MPPIPAALAALLCLALPAEAADFLVRRATIADEKAVFATVEARETVPARVRIAGTIAQLSVRRGEAVRSGQPLAMIGDPKLVFQRDGLLAEIQALDSQLTQTKADLARLETLAATGAATRVSRDQMRTQLRVQTNLLAAKHAQLDVVSQQLAEGAVLAPADGRIIDLPYTIGTVVNPGETIADIAVAGHVLRLRVPEEHARFLKPGDRVRLDAADLGGQGFEFGTVSLVYPRIEDGRVIADAEAPDLGDYFVGVRVRVWIAGAPRARFVIPAHAIVSRSGLDFVRLRRPGGIEEVPVQRGAPSPTPALPDGIEILSGLEDGDRLVLP